MSYSFTGESREKYAAKTTLELTFDPLLVRDWDEWAAVREIIQNADDARRRGFPFEISYLPGAKRPTLKITTKGTYITREALLLGNTSKAGDVNQLGEYGEGLDLYMLVLCRAGYDVWVRTGDERWVPRIGPSKQFNGADLLLVDTAPVEFKNEIVVKVQGLAPEDWEQIRQRLLFKPGYPPRKSDQVELPGIGRILTAPERRGQLYSKGIWVCTLPDRYFFGYDFDRLRLDRDRRVADPWQLKDRIQEALEAACRRKAVSPKTLYSLLSVEDEPWTEAAVLADQALYNSLTALSDTITEEFQKECKKEGKSEDTLPVSNMAESHQARHMAVDAKVVAPVIRKLVEKKTGRLVDKLSERGTDAKKLWTATDLIEDELALLEWGVKLVASAEDWVSYENIQVVDFYGDFAGSFDTGSRRVRLSREILGDPRELIETLIHEVAHLYGTDGSTQHIAAVGRISAQIIVAASNPPKLPTRSTAGVEQAAGVAGAE